MLGFNMPGPAIPRHVALLTMHASHTQPQSFETLLSKAHRTSASASGLAVYTQTCTARHTAYAPLTLALPLSLHRPAHEGRRSEVLFVADDVAACMCIQRTLHPYNYT